MINLPGTETTIHNALLPLANSLGFEIVKITFSGSVRKVLEISIDRLDHQSVTIKDCKDVSMHFATLLDVEDIISDKYYLEVSSAGIERPLVKLEDYERFKNRIAKVKLCNPYEGSRNFQAEITGVENSKVMLKLPNSAVVAFEFQEIKHAKLIFSESMFRESLSKSDKNKKPQLNQ